MAAKKPKPAGYVFGRPTKYDPSFCKIAIDLMSEGRTKLSVACKLDISLNCLYEWTERHSDFSEAIKKGEALSRDWWEDHARENLHNPEFNNTLWYMSMKNRHGYADKQHTTQNVYVKQEDALKDLE
jgi:hypothetical protein